MSDEVHIDHNQPPPDAGPALPASALVVPITVSAAYRERTLDDVLDRIRPEQGLLYQHEDIDLGGGLTATAHAGSSCLRQRWTK